MDERRFSSAFQIFEATVENDLEAAMVVLRRGTEIPGTQKKDDA